MARFHRLAKSFGFFALLLFSVLPANGETLVDTLLNTYGMEAFKRAQEIRFTFHVKGPDFEKARQWLWKPKSDSVISLDRNVSYGRKSMTEAQKSVDAEFINDQYWLTFPFHCGIDTGITITVSENPEPSPLKKESLRKVRVAYNQVTGYTPGDAYELFVTPEGLIKEWSYHKAGQKSGRAWTWEKQESFGGILISQEHQGPVHVFFTDIHVIPADKL